MTKKRISRLPLVIQIAISILPVVAQNAGRASGKDSGCFVLFQTLNSWRVTSRTKECRPMLLLVHLYFFLLADGES